MRYFLSSIFFFYLKLFKENMILIELVPNLWLGDQESVNYKEKLKINAVINCSKDLHFLGNYQEYRINIKNTLEKYEIIKMYEYMVETVEFIYKNLSNDKNVLVYCENANQKSATICAAFLIKYGKIDKENAIKSIRSKQRAAFYPDIDYGMSLDMYAKENLN